MKIYNCKVRLHGSTQDEVRRKHVTAAEIRVLRALHGEDAVVEITEAGEAIDAGNPRSQEAERDRLSRLYGEPVVNKLFGQPTVSIATDIGAEVTPTAAAKELPVVTRGELVGEQKATGTSLFE